MCKQNYNLEASKKEANTKEVKNESHPLTEQEYDDIIDSVLKKAVSGMLFKEGIFDMAFHWYNFFLQNSQKN